MQRGPGGQSLVQISPVVPAGRGQVVGYRGVQGHAAHRASRRPGQIGQSGHHGRVQFVRRRHVGHLLSDQSLLATARVAGRRELVLVRGQDH